MHLTAVTSDLETAQDILSRTYGPVQISPRGPRRGMRLEQATLGPAQFHHARLAMDFDAVGSLLESLVFGELTSGRLRHCSAGSDRRYQAGAVFLAGQPGHAYTATVQDADVQLAVIDPALPGQVADTMPARHPAAIRFTGYEAISPHAAAQWSVTCAYVRDHLLGSPGGTEAPLVAANAARLVIATALATFPNNAFTDPTVEDRHDSSPVTLRRAVEFIDEHAHEEITPADIAAAAHVTIRAVQLVFRRHMKTTPTRYLRRVRLDHAHRQLAAADPAYESITAVAYEWGFASPSRFAAYYRTAYGVSPSRTLHS